MREFSRTDRVADQIQKELALFLHKEVKDPRLAMVTVTAARVSRDLKYARVYVTFMGTDSQEQIDQGLQGLKRATGFLRSHLGKTMRMRVVPELTFVYDESIRRGRHLSALIDEAIAADQSQHDTDAPSVAEPTEHKSE